MPLCDCMSSKKAKYQFSCRVVHVHDYCVSVRFHETVQNRSSQQRCRYVSVQGPAEGAGTCRHARNRAASKSGSLLDCAHHGAPFCVCGSTGLSHVDTSSPGDTPGANLFQSLRCP